jgi:Ran GTPase-activating protein (RanGAP) involved in mRNA processing and transport
MSIQSNSLVNIAFAQLIEGKVSTQLIRSLEGIPTELLGSLSKLDLSKRALWQDLPRVLRMVLSCAPNVVELDVSHNATGLRDAIASVVELFKAGLAPKLEALVWSYDRHVSNAGAKVLAEGLPYLPALRRLHLDFINVGDEGTAALAARLRAGATPRLRVLSLRNGKLPTYEMRRDGEDVAAALRCRVGNTGAAALAVAFEEEAAVPLLEVLDLHGNHVRGDGFRALARSFERLPCLTAVNIGGNPVGVMSESLEGSALDALPQRMPQLRTLDLSDCFLYNSDASALVDMLRRGFAPLLTVLVLDSNRLTQNGALALIAALPSLPQLTSFSMKNSFTGISAAAVAAGKACTEAFAACLKLGHLPLLECLDLSDNELSDAGVAAQLASQLCNVPRLTVLRLQGIRDRYAGCFSHSVLNAASATALATVAFPVLTRLVELRLGYNNIRDEGAMALAAGLKCLPELRTLDLSRNEITATGGRGIFQHLCWLQHLEELRFDGNAVGPDGIYALAANLHFTPLLTTLSLVRLTPASGVATADGVTRFVLQESTSLSTSRLSLLEGDHWKALADVIGKGCIPRLRQLDLDNNCIGYHIIQLAAALRSVPQLEVLRLAHNYVGERAAAALAEHLPSVPRLTELSVIDGNFNDAAATILAPASRHLPLLMVVSPDTIKRFVPLLDQSPYLRYYSY